MIGRIKVIAKRLHNNHQTTTSKQSKHTKTFVNLT